MKYTIIGSGPSGLSLAYILSLNNKNVVLIEQDKQLGGSWNSEWVDNYYFSENSPRVLLESKNNKKLLSHLGFTKKDFQNIYGNFFQTNFKMFSFITKYFNLLDYFVFLFSFIKYNFVTENITLSQWMNGSYLSESAKKAVKIISILICDRPDKTNINDFFSSISAGFLKQMREPNKWHRLIENYLLSKKNVKILKNTKVVKIEKNEFSFSVYIKNLNRGYNETLTSDKVFLCTQSNAIFPILNSSCNNVKNNWLPIQQMKKWSENTFYSGFGFQLHFDKIVPYKNEWCWSCQGDWTVIILPVSNWLKEFSKDPSIKTVWSCCIVDMDSKSKRTNKTANESTRDEVLEECLFQINNGYTIPKPKVVTTSTGLYNDGSKWVSKNTGYTKNTYQDLDMKGKMDNLFALGCFTKSSKNQIAHMGTAVDSVAEYVKKYEKLNINIFK